MNLTSRPENESAVIEWTVKQLIAAQEKKAEEKQDEV